MVLAPRYWDYQFKTKYYLNKNHSVTFLAFGAGDSMDMVNKKASDAGEDPLIASMQSLDEIWFHNQGIYYTYQPSKKLSNKLMAYSTFQKNHKYFNIDHPDAASVFKDFYLDSYPNIYGMKDKFKFEWWEDHSELKGGLEYTVYHFKVKGITLLNTRMMDQGMPDFSDASLFKDSYVDDSFVNQQLGMYLKNKFTFGDFTVMPGIRSDYLARAETATLDPRGMMSYEFPTDTTIAVAGGKYSYFFQTNPALFNSNPDIAKLGNDLKPEEAYHRSVSVDQKIDLYSIKIEGFYNNFWNIAMAYPHLKADGSYLEGLNSGKLKAYGAEIMLRKDKRENENGFFCWLSYTYTRSKFKTGIPDTDGYAGQPANTAGDPYGDMWINFYFEQRYSLKLTAGYTFRDNFTASGKFQFYSSYPYTPIVGSAQDTGYSGSGSRYVPVYGEKNSKHFDPHHTLDVRCAYKLNTTWGYVNFYIEVLNVYNNVPENYQKYDYRYPYSSSNPEITNQEGAMFSGLTPNFGVEVKF